MQALRVVPKIFYFDTFKEFNEEFNLGKGDILVTNEWMYTPYVKPLGIDIPVIYQEKYGKGEPSDEMIDAMVKDMGQYDYNRIIAFGGGTIVDICKILALEPAERSEDLFTGKKEPKKVKELIVVPSTCGTGSEVTNVAIAELKSLNTKKGLAVEETYADMAMIMEGYKAILRKGNNSESRKPLLKDFILAANYAGIAFGNAGCAAVHALSYAIGGAFHVPHGEANYQFFTEVFKMYMRKNPNGKIKKANEVFANILGCKVDVVYDELEKMLNQFIPKKALREYGMNEAQIQQFTDMTVENQQRLLANNYVYLSDEEIREIFANLY